MHQFLRVFVVLSLFVVASPLRGAEPGKAAGVSSKVDFNLEVRPLLSDRCFPCHGPDSASRQADLRLDQPGGAFAVLESIGTPAIVPGRPDESELIRRITSDDEYERMPPPDSHLQLSPKDVNLLQRWIEQGAEYQPHWAFIPLQPVEVPAEKDDPWAANAIDAFILHRLRQQELKPAEPASKVTWLRRATFDLTGLPPTLDELDAFLADDSEGAYAAAVDRLLASPHFGERMAAEWLDVARYSDSYGYQVDRDRFVWPWRDWVIRAFNRNLPYDQFLIEQLAGDLLPNATDDQILATTFCRLHPQKVEGGSDPEEFRVEYVADRVQTFATAMLGLTVQCARCHDHKFDPITQKEYFQLFAFFDDIDEAGLYSYFTDSVPTPTLMLLDEAAKQKLAEQRDKVSQEEAELAELSESRKAEFETWLQSSPDVPETPTGEIAALDFEEVAAPNRQVPGIHGAAAELTGDDGIPVNVGNFKRSQSFSVSLWIKIPRHLDRAVIYHRSRAWTDAASRGYELLILDGKLSAALVHFDPGNSLRVETEEPVPLKEWQHVTVTYDGSCTAAGLRISLNGQAASQVVVRDKLTKQIQGGGQDTITIGERFRDRGFRDGQIDEFRVFDRELTSLEISQLAGRASIQELVKPPALNDVAEINEESTSELFDYYLATQDAEYQRQRKQLQAAREALCQTLDAATEIMVMQEMESPKPAYRLERGAYDARAEEVFAATPEMFPPMPSEAPRNRLGLARWLVDPQHPMTARVVVNRYWQLVFGAGLIRTPEDLGSQSEQPTHPLLLDYLANDFIAHGWDVQYLLKQMVLSSTYRQSSEGDADAVARDPQNRWWGRSMNFRLPAEMIRDNALAVSGLLVREVGGPPTHPYDVEVAFKPVERDHGPGLYRRSVYTYWNRTGPAPAMIALDAAKRDVCQVRRERTQSPLQPLVMLNGPQFVEAARVLAERVIHAHPDSLQLQQQALFRWTTSRLPNEAECRILQRLYDEERASFAEDPQRAAEFLATGEAARDEAIDPAQLAALTTLANVLLNYDECVIRR